jgi:NADH dehydrogenase
MSTDERISSSDEQHEPILLTGGTGFVGSAIRRALRNRSLRLLVRTRTNLPQLPPNVDVVEGDVTDRDSLRGVAEGCATVVHLVAIIEEHGNVTFDRVIRQGTDNVLEEATRAGVTRFVHMSALGAQDNPRYAYMQAKWRAEQSVIESGLAYTIFRPSVIFGPGDGFINALAKVIKQFPVIPVVGTGKSKFQPVAVEQVATAFARAVGDPATTGKIYELGGARVYSYEEMLDIIAHQLGKQKPKVHVPVGLMKPVVQLSKPLPAALRPPVTIEQLNMLALDNTTDDSATQRLVGAVPIALEDGIGYVNER